MRDKKGTLDDKIYFMFLFFAIILMLGVVFVAYTPIYEALTGLGSTAVNNAIANIAPASLFNWVDWMAFFGYFAINILISIVLPLRIEHNPVFVAALFIFSFIYAFIIAILANTAVDFLDGLSAPYTLTMVILNNWVLFEVIFILILAVIMFMKRSSGGDVYYTQ